MRRILPILIIILFSALSSYGQENRVPGPETQNKAKLYPNPATTYITFDLQQGYQKGLTIVVYNFLGKKMYESQNVQEKTVLNLSDFNRGVYIYHVADPGGKLIDSGKFQVSR